MSTSSPVPTVRIVPEADPKTQLEALAVVKTPTAKLGETNILLCKRASVATSCAVMAATS